MQLMISSGAQLEVETIPVWEDCGTREALLKTNRYLLDKHGFPRAIEGSVILPPVYISDSARVKNSIIGPYVSISDDAVVEHSILRDCIISENAHIENRVMERSLVGRDARVSGTFQRMNVGDSSEIDSVVANNEP